MSLADEQDTISFIGFYPLKCWCDFLFLFRNTSSEVIVAERYLLSDSTCLGSNKHQSPDFHYMFYQNMFYWSMPEKNHDNIWPLQDYYAFLFQIVHFYLEVYRKSPQRSTGLVIRTHHCYNYVLTVVCTCLCGSFFSSFAIHPCVVQQSAPCFSTLVVVLCLPGSIGEVKVTWKVGCTAVTTSNRNP